MCVYVPHTAAPRESPGQTESMGDELARRQDMLLSSLSPKQGSSSVSVFPIVCRANCDVTEGTDWSRYLCSYSTWKHSATNAVLRWDSQFHLKVKIHSGRRLTTIETIIECVDRESESRPTRRFKFGWRYDDRRRFGRKWSRGIIRVSINNGFVWRCIIISALGPGMCKKTANKNLHGHPWSKESRGEVPTWAVGVFQHGVGWEPLRQVSDKIYHFDRIDWTRRAWWVGYNKAKIWFVSTAQSLPSLYFRQFLISTSFCTRISPTCSPVRHTSIIFRIAFLFSVCRSNIWNITEKKGETLVAFLFLSSEYIFTWTDVRPSPILGGLASSPSLGERRTRLKCSGCVWQRRINENVRSVRRCWEYMYLITGT